MFNISVLALGLVLLWQQPAPRPAFRSEVNYVELDVSVLNRDGSRVRGLGKDDFEVFESGKPQTIGSFAAVDLAIPATATLRSGAARTIRDESVASNVGATDGRVYVIVMDQLHLAVERSGKVRSQVAQFIDDFMGPADVASVVTLAALPKATPFTSNKARLRAALGTQGDLYGTASDLAAADPTPSGIKHDDEWADEIAALAAMGNSRMATATLNSFDALARVGVYLRGLQGRRKSLIYVSQGVNVNPGPLEQNTVNRTFTGMIAGLIAANVTVYTIDPRGLSAFDPFTGSAAKTWGPAATGGDTDMLRTFARDAGGLAFVGYNNLRDPFLRIAEDASSYYLIGYSSDQKLDGKFHPVTVRVRGRDVSVRVRSGIQADPPKSLTRDDVQLANAWRETDLANLLGRPLPAGDLGLALRATASTVAVSNSGATIQFALEVAGAGFTFADRNGIASDDIEVAFQALDETNALKATESERVTLRLSAATTRTVVERGWRYTTEFTVSPGRYQLRIAATESGGQRAGSVFVDVVAPDLRKTPLAITGLALTSQSARLVPTAGNTPTVRALTQAPITASRTFNVTDTLTVLAGIVDTAAGDRLLSAGAQLRAADGKIAIDLPMSLKTEDVRTGEAPRVFTLPLKDVAPGEYDVVVRVADGAKTVSWSLPITVVR